MLKKESELLVEVAHAWGSHHFRARAISIKSSLSKDIMSHLRVRAASRRWTNLKFEVKLRFGPMHRNSVDASNLKAPHFFFLGGRHPKKKNWVAVLDGAPNFFFGMLA